MKNLQIGFRIFMVIVLFLWQVKTFSQNVDSACKVQMSLLQTNDQTDNNTIEELVTNIEDLTHHPIDLNNALFSDIEKLTMLSDFQIASLWQYLEKHRPVLSIYELRVVMGFDSKDMEAIKNFVTCRAIVKPQKILVRNRVTVLEQYGETMIDDSVISNPKYQGKPTKTLTKVQSDIGEHLHLSAIADKDPYEHFGKQGFDYYSANICIEKKYFIKKMILGDFSMHFGQGLVAWNGYTFSNLTDIRKRGKGLMAYNGVDEDQFYRGLGVTLGNKHCDLSIIASSHFIDGTIDSATNTITSLQKTGYHRTASELANKHSLRMSSLGGDITYRFPLGNIGLTHISHFFDKAILPIHKAYNLYSFSGKQMSATGINFFLNLNSADLFGEAAVNEKFRTAILLGGEFQFTGFLQFSILFRNYHPGYYSFMNSGFSAVSKTTNERGLYWSLRSSIDTTSSIMATVDLYEHPWFQYGLYEASAGSSVSIIYERNIPNNGKILLQYKHYNKPINDTTSGSHVKAVSQFRENRMKVALYSQISEQWRFVTQGVCAFVDLKTSPSVYFSQDIDYYLNSHFFIGLRYSVFDATYGSQITVYEPDVRVGTNASFFGDGDKYYIKANYRFLKRFLLSAKYACLNKCDQKIYTSKNECSVLLNCEF